MFLEQLLGMFVGLANDGLCPEQNCAMVRIPASIGRS